MAAVNFLCATPYRLKLQVASASSVDIATITRDDMVALCVDGPLKRMLQAATDINFFVSGTLSQANLSTRGTQLKITTYPQIGSQAFVTGSSLPYGLLVAADAGLGDDSTTAAVVIECIYSFRAKTSYSIELNINPAPTTITRTQLIAQLTAVFPQGEFIRYLRSISDAEFNQNNRRLRVKVRHDSTTVAVGNPIRVDWSVPGQVTFSKLGANSFRSRALFEFLHSKDR